MVIMLLAWIVLSVLTAAVCSLVARGGRLADRAVVSVPSTPTRLVEVPPRSAPSLVGAGHGSAPSPRRPLEGMAEFNG